MMPPAYRYVLLGVVLDQTLDERGLAHALWAHYSNQEGRRLLRDCLPVGGRHVLSTQLTVQIARLGIASLVGGLEAKRLSTQRR